VALWDAGGAFGVPESTEVAPLVPFIYLSIAMTRLPSDHHRAGPTPGTGFFNSLAH
jgi:hypothetical protein